MQWKHTLPLKNYDDNIHQLIPDQYCGFSKQLLSQQDVEMTQLISYIPRDASAPKDEM